MIQFLSLIFTSVFLISTPSAESVASSDQPEKARDYPELTLVIPVLLNPLGYDDWFYRLHYDGVLAIREAAENQTGLGEIPMQILFYADQSLSKFDMQNAPQKAKATIHSVIEFNPDLADTILEAESKIADQDFVERNKNLFRTDGVYPPGTQGKWAPVQLVQNDRTSSQLFPYNEPLKRERERVKRILENWANPEASLPLTLTAKLAEKENLVLSTSSGEERLEDFVNRAKDHVLSSGPVSRRDAFLRSLLVVANEINTQFSAEDIAQISNWIESGPEIYLILQFLQFVEAQKEKTNSGIDVSELSQALELSPTAAGLLEAKLYLNFEWIFHGAGVELLVHNYSSDRVQVQSQLHISNRSGKSYSLPFETANGDAAFPLGRVKAEAFGFDGENGILDAVAETCFYDLRYEPINATNLTNNFCQISRSLNMSFYYPKFYGATTVYSEDYLRELQADQLWFFLGMQVMESLEPFMHAETRSKEEKSELREHNPQAPIMTRDDADLPDSVAYLIDIIESNEELRGNTFASRAEVSGLRPLWQEDRALDTLIDKENFDLRELFDLQAGKPMIVQIGAPWCGPCHRASDALSNLYSEFKNYGLRVINLQMLPEDQDEKILELNTLDKLLRNKDQAFPYILLSRETQDSLGLGGEKRGRTKLPALPIFLFLNSEHEVIGVSHGFSEDSVKNLVKNLDFTVDIESKDK